MIFERKKFENSKIFFQGEDEDDFDDDEDDDEEMDEREDRRDEIRRRKMFPAEAFSDVSRQSRGCRLL